jgi:ABC-2 type transport system ATP-binding protein
VSIRVEKLAKRYSSQWAVDRISFDIPQGQIVGFLGPNGAGKSTTMKILTGYIPPTEGKAFMGGLDVEEQSVEVRKITGYLPEHNPLYLDMYIQEYLGFVAKLNQIDRPKRAIEAAIGMTQLGKERHKKIGQLSKGYRQRVGLAQALIHDPKILILDEPTSGLDPNQVQEMRQVIKTLGQEKTVLLSTHIMQEVQAMCDRVIIIHQGQLVADGDIASLQSNKPSSFSVRIELDKPCELNRLLSIEGCDHAESTGPNTYLLRGHSSDLRSSIADAAKAGNWTVLEMRSETHSLEDVFRDLTS